MHPGAYDAKARLKYMDELGIGPGDVPERRWVWESAIPEIADPALKLACVQAHNDWQTEWPRWTRVAYCRCPDAVLGRAETVREVRAVRPRATRAFSLPAILNRLTAFVGEPALNRCGGGRRVDLPISHISSGNMEDGMQRDKMKEYGRMATFTVISVNVFLRNGMQLNDHHVGRVGSASQN
jgi:hypothetical protein